MRSGESRLRRVAALVVAISLAAVSPPRGARADGGPLILHLGASGGGLPPALRQEVADRLGLPAEELSPPRPFVDYVFEGALLWPTDAAAAPCPTDAASADLEERIAAAEEDLAELAFGDAAAGLAVVTEAPACLAAPVTGPRLARAAFLLGYARFMAGDREGSADAFWIAAQLDPTVEWDNTYPPEVQQTFNNAVLDALRTPAAHIAYSEEFWKRRDDVRLDGAVVPESGEVRPGLHLVTLPSRNPGGVAAGVELPAGGTVHLWPVEDLIVGLLEGDALGEPALAALVAALDRHGLPDAYVVEPGTRRMFRFHAASRQLRELPTLRPQPIDGDRPAVQRRPLPQLPPPSLGGTLIVAGGAATVVGLALGIALREEALDIYNQVSRDPDMKGRYRDDFYRAKGGMTAGFVIAGLGGVSVGVGIPVTVRQHQRQRDATAALRWSVQRAPDGTTRSTLCLTGRW